MYFLITVLTALMASVAPVVAIPAAKDYSTIPQTAAVDFYQGQLSFEGPFLTSTNGTCGFAKVSNGTYTSGNCNSFKTFGVGFHQKANRACKIKVWDGVDTCSGTGTWTEIVIPKGKETTCIRTGVLDGGRFQKASGVYSCFDN